MKQIPLLQGKALLIELPEGAKMQGLQTTSPNAIVYADTHGHGVILDLPPGNWHIVGMLSEVTEEQAKGMVDYFTTDEDFGKEDVFRDYKGEAFYDTALESLESAILAEGWYFENLYGSHPDTWDYLFEAMHHKPNDVRNWEAAQSRVLDHSRCLLLGRESN